MTAVSVCWDNQGHRIIGLIAGNYVTETTEKFLRESIKTRAQDIPRSMAYASVWADMRQNDAEYEWSIPMHFAFTDAECSEFDEARDCPNGKCLVTAIADFSVVASDPTKPKSIREEAVNFLIHLMGDIHQPLHIGFHKDEGGSKIWLSDPPKKNLHTVWDSVIITQHIEKELKKNKHRKWNYYTLAHDIMSDIGGNSDAVAGGKIKVPSDTGNRDEMKAYAAAIASETTSSFTCKYAYKHEPQTELVYDGRGNMIGSKLVAHWIASYDLLSELYMKSRLKIVKGQYVRAGVRLAKLLNAIAAKYFAAKKELEPSVVHARKARLEPKHEPVVYSNRFADLEDAGCSDDASTTDDSEDDPCDNDSELSDVELDEMDLELVRVANDENIKKGAIAQQDFIFVSNRRKGNRNTDDI